MLKQSPSTTHTITLRTAITHKLPLSPSASPPGPFTRMRAPPGLPPYKRKPWAERLAAFRRLALPLPAMRDGCNALRMRMQKGQGADAGATRQKGQGCKDTY